MVGFRDDDPLSSNQKLVAGIVAGVITRCITQPVDVLKIRAQLLRRRNAKGLGRIARRIYREEGVKAFWQGHALGQIHSILAVSSQFYFYELATKYGAGFQASNSNRSILYFFCGVLSGCLSTVLVIPLEVIRVRQMLVHEQYKGLFRGARNVYRLGGVTAFYEGLSASLIQVGPSAGISFSTFRFCQSFILSLFDMNQCTTEQIKANQCPASPPDSQRAERLIVASTIAGSIAGFVSKTVTYPFDLIKRRLQIGSHQISSKYKTPSQVQHLASCKHLLDCFATCYRKEGLKGFYRGWTVTILKGQITSIVAFTSYEMLCHIIMNLDKKYN